MSVETVKQVKTKRPSRKKEDREERRQRLLQGAMDLIEREGVDGLSVNQLAKELGYTPGALYRYFRSKDALIAGLQCDVIRTLRVALEGVWTEARQDEGWKSLAPAAQSLALLDLAVSFYVAYADASPAHYRLNSRLTTDPRLFLQGEESLLVFAEAGLIWKHVGGLLLAAGLSQELEQSLEQATLLWTSLHGVLLAKKLMRFAPEGWSLPAVIEEFAHTLWRGWGTNEDDLQASTQWKHTFLQTYPLQERASLEYSEAKA